MCWCEVVHGVGGAEELGIEHGLGDKAAAVGHESNTGSTAVRWSVTGLVGGGTG